jgi:hypothetical protein
MLDANPGVGTGESWWKADASVGTVVKSSIGEGWRTPGTLNNAEGCWIPAPPNNGEGSQTEADPPDDASPDFEEDYWWLIAERVSFEDKNDGFMVMG